MKCIMMAMAVFSLSCIGFSDELTFKTIVLDGDTKMPVSNVVVEASFQNNTFSWNDPIRYDNKVGVTDADGIVRLRGRTNCGIVSCVVDDCSGYYGLVRLRSTGTRANARGSRSA